MIICVRHGNSGYKDENNKCLNDGEHCQYFFVEIEYSILGEIQPNKIKKCVSNCKDESEDYKFILRSTNECLKNCPAGTYEVGNYCYNECTEGNKYILPPNYNCVGDCDVNYPVKEILSETYSNIFLCKEAKDFCEGKFYTKNDKKVCVSECPKEYNCLIDENECKEDCNNGQIKILIERKQLYNIFKCTDSCPDQGYYSDEDFACYDSCLKSSTKKYSLKYEQNINISTHNL